MFLRGLSSIGIQGGWKRIELFLFSVLSLKYFSKLTLRSLTTAQCYSKLTSLKDYHQPRCRSLSPNHSSFHKTVAPVHLQDLLLPCPQAPSQACTPFLPYLKEHISYKNVQVGHFNRIRFNRKSSPSLRHCME